MKPSSTIIRKAKIKFNHNWKILLQMGYMKGIDNPTKEIPYPNVYEEAILDYLDEQYEKDRKVRSNVSSTEKT